MSVRGVFVNASERRALSPGDVLFNAGDSGTEMFGVISGAIELSRGDHVIATIGPDGTFGEMSLIDQSPRSLTTIARRHQRWRSSTSACSCSWCTRHRCSRCK